MARVKVSYEFVQEAMQSKTVRDALAARARRIESRAASLAAAENAKMDIEVSHGTRPKGRPYSRVSAPDGAAQEWGTSNTERRRILGRAGEST